MSGGVLEKNYSMKKFVLTLVVFLFVHFVQAQAPKYSNEFLSLGVGARGIGMSNSTVASTGDVSSGYWNPAGLLQVKSTMELALMHSNYFADIAKFDYGAIAIPVDTNSALGFSFMRFAIDDIPNTLFLVNPDGSFDYSKIKSFSAADYAFLISYARKPKIKDLVLGANFKVIHRVVGDFGKSWGFGLDVGAQYTYGKWKFGAMGRDITTTFNSWSYSLTEKEQEIFTITGNEIPTNSTELTLPKLILGTAYTYTIKEKFTVMPELNVDVTFDGQRNVLISNKPMSFDPHLGLELGFKNIIFLRGGIYNIQRIKDLDGSRIYSVMPNFGIGLKFKNLSIDYALANIGQQAGVPYSNIFSLKLDFFKKKKYNFE